MPKTKLAASVKPWRVIGENIRVLLAIKNITQKELAERLDASPASVSNWILGKTAVPSEKIWRAAEVLGTTPAQLVTPRDSANCSRLIV